MMLSPQNPPFSPPIPGALGILVHSLPGPSREGHEGEGVACGHILRGKAQRVKDLRGQALLKYMPGPGESDLHSLPPHLTSRPRDVVPQGQATQRCSYGGHRCAERSGCLWAEQRPGSWVVLRELQLPPHRARLPLYPSNWTPAPA